jgi:cyclopropane-fatty-acyl-phospholipid synthase
MFRLLKSFFTRIFRKGTLFVEAPDGRILEVGDRTGNPVSLKIEDRGAALRLLYDPSLALGELFMNRRITLSQGTIYDFLALTWRNLGLAEPPGPAKILAHARRAGRRFFQINGASRAKRNAAHHYNLDGRLYDLFLDDDRQYSCAYFEHPHQSLDDAQQAKKRHIAAKLHLQPGAHVLDIGSGWGGLALYLDEVCNAHVTGITLSEEQLAVSRQRAAHSRNVTFRLQDYRDVTDAFDRIVSVGMFEHVGLPYYDSFFRKAHALLREDGVMLLHTIGRIDVPGGTNAWMSKYIFPGGYVPALSDMMPPIERAGLIVTDVEVLRLHYAETLRAWRERFISNRPAAEALYDDRFCRMWEYYLAACETAFRFGNLVVFQIQLTKELAALPITRDYILEAESRLLQKERRLQAHSGLELPLGSAAHSRASA